VSLASTGKSAWQLPYNMTWATGHVPQLMPIVEPLAEAPLVGNHLVVNSACSTHNMPQCAARLNRQHSTYSLLYLAKIVLNCRASSRCTLKGLAYNTAAPQQSPVGTVLELHLHIHLSNIQGC
jgi:hypothetical protein